MRYVPAAGAPEAGQPEEGVPLAGGPGNGSALEGPWDCGLGTEQDSKNNAAATVQDFLNTNIFTDLLD